MKVRLEGPGNISIFIYDNNTCIVESFLDTATRVNLVTAGPFKSLTDLLSNEKITGTERKFPAGWGQELTDENVYPLTLKPHSYRVFKFE